MTTTPPSFASQKPPPLTRGGLHLLKFSFSPSRTGGLFGKTNKRSRLLYTAGIVFVVSESARGTAAAKASAAPAETTAETASAAVMVITHH